jgi:hypothetical protein
VPSGHKGRGLRAVLLLPAVRHALRYSLRNHPELAFRDGQGRIVHLEADLYRVIEWADTHGRHWAFSLSNAGARYTQFRSDRARLDELDWTAIAARDFHAAEVKEAKQAEFLLHEGFPFELVEAIGVASAGIKVAVDEIMEGTAYRPRTEVRPDWYY